MALGLEHQWLPKQVEKLMGKGAKYRFALQDGTWDFSWDAVADKGPHLAMTREARGFSRVAVWFSSYDGEFRLPLVLAQEV